MTSTVWFLWFSPYLWSMSFVCLSMFGIKHIWSVFWIFKVFNNFMGVRMKVQEICFKINIFSSKQKREFLDWCIKYNHTHRIVIAFLSPDLNGFSEFFCFAYVWRLFSAPLFLAIGFTMLISFPKNH